MVKSCSKCGNKNPDNAKFCEYCGNNLIGAKKESNQAKNSTGVLDGVSGWWNEQDNRTKTIIGIVGVCCLGLILIVGIGGMMSPDKTTTTQPTTTTTQPTTTPTTTTTPSTTNTTTATTTTTGELAITSSSGKYDSVGVFHITGQVKNNGASDAQYVELVGTGFDSSGNVVDTDTSYASLDTIPAGGTSPFDIMLLNTDNKVVKYTVQVNQ